MPHVKREKGYSPIFECIAINYVDVVAWVDGLSKNIHHCVISRGETLAPMKSQDLLMAFHYKGRCIRMAQRQIYYRRGVIFGPNIYIPQILKVL